MIRSFLETVTRNWKYKRRLPKSFAKAPIIVSPSAGLKYLFQSMESIDPVLLNVCKRFVKPGNCVWDIGANIGIFSIASAACAGEKGKVYSFEPDPWLIQLLRRSAQMQQARNSDIEVMPIGVAGSSGFRRLSLATRSRATNHLDGYGLPPAGSIREMTTIYCVHLDLLAEQLQPPDFIKIDVEGAEIELLQGGAQCFEKHRPIIFIEVSQKNSAEVTELLHSYDFNLFDGDSDLADPKPIDKAVFNTIAIPR